MTEPLRFTLKEEIVLRVLPGLVRIQYEMGRISEKGSHEVGTAAVNIANATIAALEADE